MKTLSFSVLFVVFWGTFEPLTVIVIVTVIVVVVMRGRGEA